MNLDLYRISFWKRKNRRSRLNQNRRNRTKNNIAFSSERDLQQNSSILFHQKIRSLFKGPQKTACGLQMSPRVWFSSLIHLLQSKIFYKKVYYAQILDELKLFFSCKISQLDHVISGAKVKTNMGFYKRCKANNNIANKIWD